MKDVIETIEKDGYFIEILPDIYPESPREWSNLGSMQCFHSRYDLGDKKVVDSNDYKGWSDMEYALKKDHDAVIILPIYMYDHSGITVNTKPFSCPWDSGRLGLIFASREDILVNFNVKRLTKSIIERATKILEGEVETYDQFLRGDVYGYRIEDKDGDEVDSCYGFYGIDTVREEAMLIVKSLLKSENIRNREKMKKSGQLSLGVI